MPRSSRHTTNRAANGRGTSTCRRRPVKERLRIEHALVEPVIVVKSPVFKRKNAERVVFEDPNSVPRLPVSWYSPAIDRKTPPKRNTAMLLTREEEAIGIAAGAYAVGRNAAVFMQSSGFGNSINAIASLCIPARVPIPIFINLRGGVGEFNIAQVAMGRTTRPILDLLGLVHFTLDDENRLDT